jgi:hypothetical protein
MVIRKLKGVFASQPFRTPRVPSVNGKLSFLECIACAMHLPPDSCQHPPAPSCQHPTRRIRYRGAPFKRTMNIITKAPPVVTKEKHGVTYSDGFAALCATCLKKEPKARSVRRTRSNAHSPAILDSLHADDNLMKWEMSGSLAGVLSCCVMAFDVCM